mmetsp:Transcript_44206/g.136601  ORF Transcript_44206/g.136601 Transcript_44206/m.136601 type:complete len:312 (+) Transcript_44206:63-998(+)
MPSTCRPLRAACCLAALAAAVREGSESEAQAGLGLAGASNLAAEDLPSWVWSLKYFVFVKKVDIGKAKGALGWHTETDFCPLRKGAREEGALELLAPELAKEKPKSMADEVVLQGWSFFDKCWATGHGGAEDLYPVDYASDESAFFPTENGGKPKFYFVGTVDFSQWVTERWPDVEKKKSLMYFVEDMRTCGNWESEDYSLLGNNCNHYTDTLLRALDLRSPTTHRFVEANRKHDVGYMDIKDGKCKGRKCGTCEKGVCEDIGETNVCNWMSQNAVYSQTIPGTQGCTVATGSKKCAKGFCHEGGAWGKCA